MHRGTERIVMILDYISSNNGEKTLTEISESLNIPKGTISPLLKTLENLNCITSDENKYSIGPKLFTIGTTFTKTSDLIQDIEIEVKNLSNAVGQTCYFSVLENGYGLYLVKQSVTIPISISTKVGTKLPAYATGIGKSLLRDHSLESLINLYGEKLKKLQENTIDNVYDLYNELQKNKKIGYSFENQESTQFVRCIAIPIEYNDKVIAAMSVATPIMYYDDEFEKNTMSELRKYKKIIENLISENINDWHFSSIK